MALDRIIAIRKAEGTTYVGSAFFDPETYFDNIVGVTKNTGGRVTLVVLHVDNGQSPYVLTKPLHSTQKLVAQDDGGITISIDVALNIELEARILNYAPHIVALSPHSLRSRIKRSLQLSLANYMMGE